MYKYLFSILAIIGSLGSISTRAHAASLHDIAFEQIKQTIGYTVKPLENSVLLPVLEAAATVTDNKVLLKGNNQKTIEVIGFTTTPEQGGNIPMNNLTDSLYTSDQVITFHYQKYLGIDCREISYVDSHQVDLLCLQHLSGTHGIAYYVQLLDGKAYDSSIEYSISDLYYQFIQPIYEFMVNKHRIPIRYYFDFIDSEEVKVIQLENATACEQITTSITQMSNILGIKATPINSGQLIKYIHTQSSMHILQDRLPLIITHIDGDPVYTNNLLGRFLQGKSNVVVTMYDIKRQKSFTMHVPLHNVYYTNDTWICPPAGDIDSYLIDRTVEKLFVGYQSGTYSYSLLQHTFRKMFLQFAQKNDATRLVYATEIRNNLARRIQESYTENIDELLSGTQYSQAEKQDNNTTPPAVSTVGIPPLDERLTKLESLIDTGTYEEARAYLDRFPNDSRRVYSTVSDEPAPGVNNLLEDIFPGQGPTGFYQDYYQSLTDTLAEKRFIELADTVLKDKNGSQIIRTLLESDHPVDYGFAAPLFLAYDYKQEDTDDFYAAVRHIFQKVLVYHSIHNPEEFIQKILTRDDKEVFERITELLPKVNQSPGVSYLLQVLLRTGYEPAITFAIDAISAKDNHSDLPELYYMRHEARDAEKFTILYKLLHKVRGYNLVQTIHAVKQNMTQAQKEQFIEKLTSPEAAKESIDRFGHSDLFALLNVFLDESLVINRIDQILQSVSTQEMCNLVAGLYNPEYTKKYATTCNDN